MSKNKYYTCEINWQGLYFFQNRIESHTTFFNFRSYIPMDIYQQKSRFECWIELKNKYRRLILGREGSQIFRAGG